jgi:hypothetical protein
MRGATDRANFATCLADFAWSSSSLANSVVGKVTWW